jgi:prolyl oligopeptidase
MSLNDSRFAPVEEMIHGVRVRDPHRWLEDRSLPKTEEWIQEQGRRCDAYFAECKELPAIRERVREHLDIEVVDQPAKIRNRYFYRRRDRGQEQGCIYVRDAVTGMERLLVDPSAEGSFVSVGIYRISPDGSLLAYERKHGGEDKKSIHIVDVESGVPLSYGMGRGYAQGFIFSADNRGFYHCHGISADAEEHTIWLNRFHESVAGQVVFRVRQSRGSRLVMAADSVHLGAIWVHEVDSELIGDLWMAKQADPAKWHQVLANRKLPFSPILKDGRLFAISYENAPNGKLVELNHDGQEMRVIVPDQGTTIRQLVLSGGDVYISSLDGLYSVVRSWSLDGNQLLGMELPGDGTIRLLPDLGDGSSLFLSHESFTQPQTIFEYVPAAHALSVWSQRTLHPSIKSATVRHVSYSSIDGMEIPITLVGPMDFGMGTSGPAVMTSYGGFGVALTPQFSVLIVILMECGALFALPHIRGGGEFGKAWYDAGRKTNRQTSFNDFIAAAQWLIQEGITRPQQLAIFGGSNSGLLVGAAMTQRPDLFRAVLCVAPLLDMVRYECFDQATKWREEYGSVEVKEEFQALHRFSPYHRVSDDVGYPAALFVSGDKDDRCNPAHVRKMVAQLLESSEQRFPVLMDYSGERGHSPVLPLQVRIEGLSRRIAFLCRELNMSFTDGAHYETACV